MKNFGRTKAFDIKKRLFPKVILMDDFGREETIFAYENVSPRPILFIFQS